MKDFLLDVNGDVVINDGHIQYVYENDLLTQKIRQVIGTNLGEWFGDEDEGMDFSVVLTKNPNYDLIRDAISTAVHQVDEDMDMIDFDYTVEGRKLYINFTVERNGQTIPMEFTM